MRALVSFQAELACQIQALIGHKRSHCTTTYINAVCVCLHTIHVIIYTQVHGTPPYGVYVCMRDPVACQAIVQSYIISSPIGGSTCVSYV